MNLPKIGKKAKKKGIRISLDYFLKRGVIDLFGLVNNDSMLYRLSFLLKTSLFPGIFSLFVCISKLRERYI